jgi:hypothetical protein
MRGRVIDQGNYELFNSERNHRLLMLDDNVWYRWLYDVAIPKLILTRGVSDKSGDINYDLLGRGRYYVLEEIQGDYKGLHFLLLENGNYFDVYRLVPDLPNEIEDEREIINMKEKVLAAEIDTCIYQLD